MLGSLINEDGTVDRVKKVIRKLRKSNVERERFKAFQEEAGLKQYELQKVVCRDVSKVL